MRLPKNFKDPLSLELIFPNKKAIRNHKMMRITIMHKIQVLAYVTSKSVRSSKISSLSAKFTCTLVKVSSLPKIGMMKAALLKTFRGETFHLEYLSNFI